VSAMSFSRRKLLKSISTVVPAVAIPVLRSSPLLAQPTPPRLVVFMQANGIIPEMWKPTGTADNWSVPAGGILEPLMKFKAKLNVLWGVHYKSGEKGPGSAHQKGPVAALTGVHATDKDPGYATGISIDQWMANKWGNATTFKTMEFGVKDRTSGNRGCLSYLGPNQPVFPENNPLKAFTRYFGNFAAPSSAPPTPGMPDPNAAAAAKLLSQRKSMLDFVRGDLDRLSKRLPGDERTRLDRHLDSLRELERQLEPMSGGGGIVGAACKPVAPPPTADDGGGSSVSTSSADYQPISKLQMDNMFMGLACGRSRLAHLIWAGETSQQPHPWAGVTELHHDLSHRDNEPAVKVKLTKVCRWYAEEYAYFLGRMDSVVEGNGKTMLDNSLCIFLNGMGEGKSHTRNNIPFVLAGGAGGAIKTGRFLTYDNAHNQLLVSVLHAFGFTGENQFGDPAWSGPLPGLLAT
jgi:hypothetical protein